MRRLTFGFWFALFLEIASVSAVSYWIGRVMEVTLEQGRVGFVIGFTLALFLSINAIFVPLIILFPRRFGVPVSPHERRSEIKFWIFVNIVCAWVLLVAFKIYALRVY